MKLSDFKGLFKKTFVEVLEVENPYQDYYTVKLSSPTGMTWTPGEHGIFSLPGQKISGKKSRPFSVASNPEEGFILLGIRTGEHISSFKKTLINMEKRAIVKVQGPFGWFKLLGNHKPVVLIAGGVGITPIRALLWSLKNKNTPTEVIYSSKDFYLFENDIENMVKENDKITLYKTTGKDETSNHIQSSVKKFGNEATYYISGSMDFIKSVKSDLKDSGIKKKKIINDPFFGY